MQLRTKMVTVATMILATTLFGLTQSSSSATTYPDSRNQVNGILDPDENITGNTILQGIGTSESATVEEQEELPIFTRSIRDTNMTEFGKWNPGQDRTTFWLKDPLIEWGKSVVVANTINHKTLDDPICVVSYIGNESFKLECIEPPAENTQLRYAIITSEPLPLPELASQDRANDEIKENSASKVTSLSTNNMTSR